MSRDADGDESGERVHDDAQPGGSTAMKMAHCRRDGFVGLF